MSTAVSGFSGGVTNNLSKGECGLQKSEAKELSARSDGGRFTKMVLFEFLSCEGILFCTYVLDTMCLCIHAYMHT